MSSRMENCLDATYRNMFATSDHLCNRNSAVNFIQRNLRSKELDYVVDEC